MLAETPVTQRSPCYSAVSASLTNLYQIVLIIRHFATPTTSFSGSRPFYQAAPLETNPSLLQCFYCRIWSATHVFGEVPLCLEEAEQQAEASDDVFLPPLQIVISTPFCLFLFFLSLYPLSAPFLNVLSSPFPHFP